jgi:DNA topoisomerase-2
MTSSSEDLKIEVAASPREHILHRPETYVGAFLFRQSKDPIYVVKEGKIVKAKPSFNPAFERTVIEVGSNAVDNLWRSSQAGKKCTAIRLEIREDGSISCWNDGMTIPVLKSNIPGHQDKYGPTIVFGVLMSSTNYNDAEDRRTSGRNGYGAKLTNIFSKWFLVETQDEKNGLLFSQKWSDNMSIVEVPSIVKKKGTGFTKVTWMPDYTRFGMKEGLNEDAKSVILKYFYDVAVNSSVPLFVNGSQIPIRNLSDYAKMYQIIPENEFLYLETKDSKVVVTAGTNRISFVNGIPSPEGGVHVEAWEKVVGKLIASRINGKESEKKSAKSEKKSEEKEIRLAPKDVYKHFSFFISCSLPNPNFTGQDKRKLVSPAPLGVELKKVQVDKIMTWPIVGKIREILLAKLNRATKVPNKGKRIDVPKLTDANFAGSDRSMECTLIFCEGDSAKSTIVTGIEKGIDESAGRDYFGIMPVQGKLKNIREMDPEKMLKNKFVTILKQTLGADVGVDYTQDINFMKLRYGKVMIIADADSDGYHIEGLFYNVFNVLFPSLMARNPPFITAMRSPIVRVTLKNKEEKEFYKLADFHEFKTQHGSKIAKNGVEYFKGLATFSNKEVMGWFGNRILHYLKDERTDQSLAMIFEQKGGASDGRKDWLLNYNPEDFLILESNQSNHIMTTYSAFIDTEFVNYSIDSCRRAIPNVIDGLKESQRKILYTCVKEGLIHTKRKINLERLSGLVKADSEYHHGGKCLDATIVGMSHDFPGSNNIPFLAAQGQLGTRLSGGKDAGAGRYVATQLREIAGYIFREEDTPILKNLKGENLASIEPEFYVPVIPMVLINGATGIGTGWSCDVPCFNPLDVVKALKLIIQEEKVIEEPKVNEPFFSILPELHPWYQGFTGRIEKVKEGTYLSFGVLNTLSQNMKEITELPIGEWTNPFEEKLKKLRAEEMIDDYSTYCNQAKVHFVIRENPDKMLCDHKNLKLVSHISSRNMVCYDKNEKLRKFTSVDEILYYFASVRIEAYQRRKEHIIESLKQELYRLIPKRRFVEEVIEGKLVVYRRRKDEIISSLKQGEYPLIKESYDYLLNISISSFTSEMIDKLDKEIEAVKAKLEIAEKTSIQQTWLKELDEFEVCYRKYLKEWEAEQALVQQTGKKKSVKTIVKKRRAR